MALEKFLYVGSDGFTTEYAAAVQTSSGAGDADKLAQLSANGKFDNSLINFSAFNTVFTVRAASTAAGTLATDFENGDTLDGVTLATNDRILLKDQATGSENGIYIVNASGAPTRATDYDENSEVNAGDLIIVTEGSTLADQPFILTTNNPITVDTTALVFTPFGTTTVQAGDGLSFPSGNTLTVNAGNGIKIVTDNVTVEPADFAGTGLQDDGSDNMEIDFADTATEMGTSRAVAASDLSANGANQGAKILGADPASISQSSQTTIQGVLEDMSTALAAVQTPGVSYTVGAGGVTAGDLVFISANDTILPYSTITNGHRAPGLALTTESAAATVIVAANDQVLAGVLTSATAGDIYYWDGSTLTTSIPSGSGSYVWKVGMAKNATDLHIEVDFIKKNV